MKRYFVGLGASFRAAWRGLLLAFNGERTFQVMVAATLLVLAFGVSAPLREIEQLTLILLTGAILVLELLNTMVERLVDLLKPRLSAYVRDVKDLMAAAVLTASLFGILVAIFIFAPHLAQILSGI